MPLTDPWHAIPGELLTTTEHPEDCDYNKLWRVPDIEDINGRTVALKYRDLFLVLACWHESGSACGNSEVDEFRKSPAVLLHLRTNRLCQLPDIEDVGWLWRPEKPTDNEPAELAKLVRRWDAGSHS